MAAGSSSRMRGRDKLLEQVDGLPLLLRQAIAASEVADQVIVTLPPKAARRTEVLEPISERITFLVVDDAKTGMAASFRAAARHGLFAPTMILPADMPELKARDLLKLWRAFETGDHSSIIRACTNDRKPGHPVIFPSDVVDEFINLKGDKGARDLLKKHTDRIVLIPLPGQAAIIDLDTPEDWENWRRSQGQ